MPNLLLPCSSSRFFVGLALLARGSSRELHRPRAAAAGGPGALLAHRASCSGATWPTSTRPTPPRGRSGSSTAPPGRPRRRPAVAGLPAVRPGLLARPSSSCSASAGSSSPAARSAWPALPADGAWNTAVSFVTNTNWQWYSGEAGLGPPDADGRSRGAELRLRRRRHGRGGRVRARPRPVTRGEGRVGNFWVDLVRGVLRVLLPIAFVGGLGAGRRSAWSRTSTSPTEVGTLAGGTQHIRRAGRQPGGDQGTRDQRRRLLQRQLGAPLREPDPADQPLRDLPAPAHPVRDAPHVRAIVGDGGRAGRSSP